MSTSFKEMVQKIVNIKAKASLKSSIIFWNMDSHYFKNYYLSYNNFAKVKTQGLTIKKSQPKEFKPKDSNLTKKNPLFCFTLIS